MIKLKHFLIFSLFFLALSFGCTFGGQKDFNETKLDVEEGVGIVGTLKLEELNPGLDGYISLTVRSNLGGEGASDVVIGIDNVKPFKIVECGEDRNPECKRDSAASAKPLCTASLGCAGQLDEDRGLPFRMHGTAKLFPGEELDVFWRLRAPSKDEISDIALKHPLYYDVEYTYRVNFHQSVIFMSQNEMLRRRQAKEDYVVEGESGSGAGELRFTGTTQQPVVYFFDYEPGPDKESNFSFALQYYVENKGKGLPLSDIVLLLEYPGDPKIVPDSVSTGVYGWYKWADTTINWNKIEIIASAKPPYNCVQKSGSTNIWLCDCRTGKVDSITGKEETKQCDKWINESFGDEFKKIDTTKLLIKVVKRDDFTDTFSIYAPMTMLGTERTLLKNNNIPLKIYSFNVYAMYRYFVEGKEYITVFPVRGI